MDCEYRAHAAIFLARHEAACDPFSALNLSVDKFHLREHVQHQVAAVQRFRAKSMYSNSQRLHPNGRWTSDMRLKRLQTAAMVVMVIFYPNKLL